MIEFDRLETFGNRYVAVSFRTDNRGIWQCAINETGIEELKNEPSIQTLRKSDQKEVKDILLIVYIFTHGKPPEDLSDFNT